MFILDRSKNDSSVTLDLLRAVAAQMVCVGHGISFFVPAWRPTELPLMQNVGVLIFFVLSGTLITFTLIERSKQPSYGFGTFFLERFARIYSGLIPALLFVVVVDAIVIYGFHEKAAAPYYTVKTFIANLFMLEAYRGILSNYLRWSAFGSASPLWTLAIEWHIYMFVGAVFFIWARPQHRPLMIAIAILFCQVPLHFLLGAFQADGVGKGLFSLWLAGACVLIALRTLDLPYWSSLFVALCAAACFFLVTKASGEYNFLTYATLVGFLFAVLAASQSKRLITSSSVIAVIRFFADYSFTLYLIHHTIMFAVFVITPERNLYIFAITVLISNILAIAIAFPTEMRHREFARFLTDNAEKYFFGRYRLQK
jgi:peptidoglycan/LPS O-acetylase OafA/YrhL